MWVVSKSCVNPVTGCCAAYSVNPVAGCAAYLAFFVVAIFVASFSRIFFWSRFFASPVACFRASHMYHSALCTNWVQRYRCMCVNGLFSTCRSVCCMFRCARCAISVCLLHCAIIVCLLHDCHRRSFFVRVRVHTFPATGYSTPELCTQASPAVIVLTRKPRTEMTGLCGKAGVRADRSV